MVGSRESYHCSLPKPVLLASLYSETERERQRERERERETSPIRGNNELVVIEYRGQFSEFGAFPVDC